VERYKLSSKVAQAWNGNSWSLSSSLKNIPGLDNLYNLILTMLPDIPN